MDKRLFALVFLIFALSLVLRAQDADFFRRKTIEKRMLKVAAWQLAHPRHESYDWTNGAFYAGVFAAYETTGSPVLWKALINMGE
ncbi:MAG: glycoside hydrolase family 88 protein, partial [Pyrinomonadaceae bacterium]